LLSILAKILEKLVFKKWLSKLAPEIDKLQFAFVPRSGQGTVSALTYVMHQILSFLDKPGVVRLLMVDLSKAFDLLPHQLILNKLIDLQAPKELVRWIKSYLTSRTQSVRHNEDQSEWYVASSGVPQGSVLSPLLFALTTNDLRPIHKHSVIVKFADDICLLHFLRHSVEDKLQEELENITNWATVNGLKCNATKTKTMDIQTKQNVALSRLVDHDSNIQIKAVSSVKLLGLTIDNQLSWNVHLHEVLGKIRKRTYMLHALKQVHAPPAILWNVYCSLIRSVSTYAFPAWCNINQSKFKQLMQFERRLCKMFSMPCKRDLSDFCCSMARRLAHSALDPQHPLHFIFDFKAARYSARQGNSHRRLQAKTVRFKRSIIKFA